MLLRPHPLLLFVALPNIGQESACHLQLKSKMIACYTALLKEGASGLGKIVCSVPSTEYRPSPAASTPATGDGNAPCSPFNFVTALVWKSVTDQ